jgi:hypothetical protein
MHCGKMEPPKSVHLVHRADTVTFTNPQKYVKYSVQSVQIMLGRLFNSAQ